MVPHWKQKFVLLWTGQALSILSSMVSQYALIWYLTDLTGSPAVLSSTTARRERSSPEVPGTLLSSETRTMSPMSMSEAIMDEPP